MKNSEEIDLMDYIKIIIKRKWLILIISFGAVVVSMALNFTTPKTYKVDTILEIGQIGQTEELVLESPIQLVEKIKNGNYIEKIKTKLNIKNIPSINVSNPENTMLVVMSIASPEPESAKKIIEELGNIIIEEHTKKINLEKNIFLDDKKRIENKISSIIKEQKILEEKIAYLIEFQTKNPSPSNQFLLTEAKESLENKNSEIADQYLELNSIERKINTYETTKVIKSPSVPSSPSGQSIFINIIIALCLGLFAGILLAFGDEWWKMAKNNK